MTIVRRFALGLVRANKAKGSVKTRRKTAGWSPDFLLEILQLKMSVNLNSVPWQPQPRLSRDCSYLAIPRSDRARLLPHHHRAGLRAFLG
jgi:hypothetical protein